MPTIDGMMPSVIGDDFAQKLKDRLDKSLTSQVAPANIWGMDIFDERELRLIKNCQDYANSDPAGLPGHNLLIIIAKFAKLAAAQTKRLTVEQINEAVQEAKNAA